MARRIKVKAKILTHGLSGDPSWRLPDKNYGLSAVGLVYKSKLNHDARFSGGAAIEASQKRTLGGLILIVVGLIILFHNLDISVFRFLWPLAIVAVGVYIIWRAFVKRQDAGSTLRETGFIGDFTLGRVTGELDHTSVSHFIGDVKLDLTGATLKPGTTTFRLFTFIGDVQVRLPERMPVEVDGTSLVSDMELLDRKKSGVFPTLKAKTADYDTAPNRLHIACTNLVGDITVNYK